ncbi:MAG: hypothetical protein AB8H12_18550 [Lewinella sp.]
MTFKRKVIIAALIPLVLMSIGSYLSNPPRGQANNYAGLDYMAFMMLGIGLEVFVLLVAGLVLYFRTEDTDDAVIRAGKVPKHKQWGNAFFLAIGFVLLVGVSLCFGGGVVIYG